MIADELIAARGTVQGVGFRPTVVRIARRLGLRGWVRNGSDGVLIALSGPKEVRDTFVSALIAELPPLARLDALVRSTGEGMAVGPGFVVAESTHGAVRTAVGVDAATCPACRAEVMDPAARRFRYPFTNCTHCGPRFTIITDVPYDRASTTMAGFPLCDDCRREYEDVGDRRFHAEPIACPTCGPQVALVDAGGHAVASPEQAIDAAADALLQGAIVAIKGVGSYHLCVLASDEVAVGRLRARKRRPSKPFALMVADVAMAEACAHLSEQERVALCGTEAPIVLLDRRRGADVAPNVAPGQRTLGLMLAYSPLHHLLLARVGAPIVCTSGNVTDEPPCATREEAAAYLSEIADVFVHHDRPISHRLDDGIVRVSDGALRVLRRARGFAPAPIALPPGFADASSVLALGAQWKSTICLLRAGEAVLSQHLGDLDEVRTFGEWARCRDELCRLYGFEPEAVAVDLHPSFESSRAGAAWAEARGLAVDTVQHHHAHLAACLAEHHVPLHAPPVLGIAFDGLGLGPDGTLWGGELLLATYTGFERVGSLAAVPLLGGDKAAVEPWRCLYAQISAGMGWEIAATRYADVATIRALAGKPHALLAAALRSRTISPLSTSCGRLFDAVAAAVGLHAEHTEFEGQAAIALENAATPEALADAGRLGGYVIPLVPGAVVILDTPALIGLVLDDVAAGATTATVSARFHVGLARATATMVDHVLAGRPDSDTVALSGGVWQNRLLLELTAPRLRATGRRVLVPERVPMNDGGIAFGQAVVVAARRLSSRSS